ncbi:MAG: MMPL family transporter [Opitutales bacterium]
MRRLDAFFRAWAAMVLRRGWLCIVGTLALTAAAFVYLQGHLGINANTAELFDEELDFRQDRAQLNAAFPQFDDVLMVVVESPVPEFAFEVAQTLGAALEADALVESVYWPSGSDFFRRNGLLFRDAEELADLGNRLAPTQPFLAALQRDPSLRGLYDRLSEFVANADADQMEALEPLFDELAQVLADGGQDPAHVLSWQGLMRTDDETEADPSHRQLLFVRPLLDYGRVKPAGPAIERIRQLAAQAIDASAVPATVRLTGELGLKHEEIEAATSGAIQAGLLAFVLVALVLAWSLRSFGLIVAVLLTLVCGLGLTAGFAALAVGSLNMISIAFAVLYIGLGVDYAIHLCLHYRDELRRGMRRAEAITEALVMVGPSLLLCTASTMLGFFAFVPTGFAGVAELGLIAGVGMLLSFWVSLTLLLALLKLWPVRPRLANVDTADTPHPILALPQTHPRPVRGVAIALGLSSLALVPWLRFDYDPLNLRDPGSESVQTIRALIDADAASPYTLELLFDSLPAATQARDILTELEGIARVVALDDFVPEDQDERLAQVDELNLILGGLFWGLDAPIHPPSSAQQVASLEAFQGELEAAQPTGASARVQRALTAYLGELPTAEAERTEALQRLERALLRTFPVALDNLDLALQAEGISLEGLPEDVRTRWVSEASLYRVQAIPEATLDTPEERETLAHKVSEIFPHATGDLVVTVRSGEVVLGAFQMALLLAVGAISTLLLAYLRSIRETLLILTPLLLAGLLTAATMAALGVPFNFANVIALPLLLGFGVDNGIHVIQRVRRRGDGDLLASCTARAVFYSSLTTLFSFGNLAFSPHRGTATLGVVLTLGVVFTLLATLVLLPAFIGKKAGRAQTQTSR